MNRAEQRIEWIDLMRVFAILSVILVHAAGSIYEFNLEFMQTISTQSEIFAMTALGAGRLGVPFFLMITGYLLLDREYDQEKTGYFWKNSWLRLLVCTEIWFVIYDLFLKFYAKKELTVLEMILDLLFVRRMNLVSHAWYMPMILGFYILLPFAARALKGIDLAKLRFPLIFFTVFSFGFPFAELLCSRLTGASQLKLQMSLGFSGGTYGIYLIMGYAIKKGMLKKLKSLFLAVTGAVSFIAVIVLMLLSYHRGSAYNVWYDNPFILITAVSLFELCSRIRRVPLYPAVKWLSKYTFGVYFIHYFVRYLFAGYAKKWAVILPVRVAAVFFVSGIAAFLIAYLLDRIPKIGKWMLYLKE